MPDRSPDTHAPTTGIILTVGNVEIYRDDRSLYWTSGLAVDADGAPDAYAPPGPLVARDFLRNAGTPGNWYGIVTRTGKPDGEPIIQGPQDPCPGYYVSQTALGDPSRPAGDPRRYVDSAKIPYISVPPELLHQHLTDGVHLGDVAQISYNGLVCSAIVAEVGPHGKIGEGSIALARAFNLNASPKNGGVGSGVEYRVFCGSTQGWPRTLDSINAQVIALASS